MPKGFEADVLIPPEVSSAIRVPATADLDNDEVRNAVDREAQTLEAASTYHLLEAIKDLQHDRGSREKYAKRIFWLVAAWLGVVLAILLLQGFGTHSWLGFKLADSVILAAIGSTTVSVIGMMIIVLNHFFHRGHVNQQRKDERR